MPAGRTEQAASIHLDKISDLILPAAKAPPLLYKTKLAGQSWRLNPNQGILPYTDRGRVTLILQGATHPIMT